MAPKAAAGGGGPGAGEGSSAGRFWQDRGRPVWVSSAPTARDLSALRQRYPETIAVSEVKLRPEADSWAASAVVGRSLGRRISLEALFREVRRRGELRGDLMGSYVDRGIFVLRFSDAADRDRVLALLLTVSGQAIALEAWRPDFFPTQDSIGTAVVWVRIPLLPVEFWTREALKDVVSLAGELVAVDDWTSSRRRLGFARVAVRISLDRPLRPGVLLRGLGGYYWQSFIFECVDGVCLDCGLFHDREKCGRAPGEAATAGLNPDNIFQPGGDEMQGEEMGPVLGPWLVAVRSWLPPSEKAGSAANAVRTDIPRRPGKEPIVDTEGGNGQGKKGGITVPVDWVKPTKTARRKQLAESPAMAVDGLPEARAVASAGGFAPLLTLGKEEETLKKPTAEGIKKPTAEGIKKPGGLLMLTGKEETLKKPMAEGNKKPRGLLMLTGTRDVQKPETSEAGRGRSRGTLKGGKATRGLKELSPALGPAPLKRARPADDLVEQVRGATNLVVQPTGRTRKGRPRKVKGPVCSGGTIGTGGEVTAADVPPGIFVFQAEHSGGGGSCLASSGTPDHAEAVRMVETVFQGGRVVEAAQLKGQPAGDGEVDQMA